MDTTDRSDSNLPVQFPAVLPPAVVSSLPLQRELALSSGPEINSRVILRGLTRHAWRILLIWLAISAPVIYLIWTFVPPTYEAFSLLHFESAHPFLYDPSAEHLVDLRGMERYLQTQVNLILSDQVLSQAVADSSVSKLSMIKRSEDSKADLRKKLTVEIVQDADLIRISLESANAEEAAAIVKAVVNSYMGQNQVLTQSANANLKKSLQNEYTKLTEQINEAKGRLRALTQTGNVDLGPQLPPKLSTSNAADGPAQPIASEMTEGHFQGIIGQVFQTKMKLIAAEALLKAKRDAMNSIEEENEEQSQKIDERLRARIIEEFRKDPDVIGLMDQMEKVEEQLDRTKSLVRQSNDPSRRAAEKLSRKLQDEYEELWDTKSKEIRQRLIASTRDSRPEESIAALKDKIGILKSELQSQDKVLKEVKVERKTTNTANFDYAYANFELQSLESAREVVRRYIQQVEFRSSSDEYHVSLVDPAAVPRIPTNRKQVKYMAAAPVGVLFSMLGLFLLLEIRAQRVADPDHLSTRIRSEVYALPPLPTARSVRKKRKLSGPEADENIEQFIQRLDHVRFAVCGSIVQAGKGRCVLITSAIGGEGKTTLAAQLAARCGNAGMSTLLIDADLRRAALCPLLDVAEGPGLSDVLKDEALIEEVIIRVQGGSFNLLPAGTPVHDTSRVFHDRKFGLLIAELRQLYDLIIIDSPPVLPVPDALILGRWADGAVLTARYDISRFPQIERARRQLDGAGIAILGTVINGMRNANSYYGRYTYSRRQSPQPNPSHSS
jgi:polysaccharide biosynthesis transport protein